MHVAGSDGPEGPLSERNSRVVLIVPNVQAATTLGAILADRYASHDMRIEILDGDASDGVARMRKREGGAPLGFVAVDEVAAHEALLQGADEVLVWPPGDDQAVHGFFDRTRLRASLRKGQERASAALAHAEKLSALGTLVAGVAHEINNPLMALQLSIEACLSLIVPLNEVSEELKKWANCGWGATHVEIRALHERSRTGASNLEAKHLLEEMLAASSAIANVVRDLRVFARADADREEPQLLDANEVIEQALRLVGREISMVAHIERDFQRGLPAVFVPHGRLTQVLVNVLVNAAQAINDIARPAHHVRITTRSDSESVAVSIADTGPGIAPEVLDQIFDPFFTTKRTGHGTGLGLSISRSIMRELGGDLIVESVHGSGATFVALLPLPDPETAKKAFTRERTVGNRSIPPTQRPTVLVVDDDQRVLKAYARLLAENCDVLTASDGQEAIELLSSGSLPDMLVSELSLPEVDGPSLFEWIARERPALARRAVFVTAEATRERYRSFVDSISNPVLTKPVAAAQLRSALEGIGPKD